MLAYGILSARHPILIEPYFLKGNPPAPKVGERRSTANKEHWRYDFTFNFSPIGPVQGQRGGGGERGGAPPANANSNVSDPNGAVSLFDAMLKQLGLKLEMRKRPLPVLVIDHVEEKPTEN